MRKDVECTFGILKKRWTILTKGVEARSIDSADQVWLTCCALHNFLIDVDGYDSYWCGGTNEFASRRLQQPESFSNNNVLHETSAGISDRSHAR